MSRTCEDSGPPVSLFPVQNLSFAIPVFVEELNDRFVCVNSSYSHVLRPPVRQLCCGHRICHQCLKDLKEKKDSIACPGDEEDCRMVNIRNKQHVMPDFGIEKDLKRLMVYCSNKKYGCTSEMTWSNLKAHVNDVCKYHPCKFSDFGCHELMEKRMLNDHEKQCAFTPKTCEHCKNTMSTKEYNEKHQNECKSWPVTCETCKQIFTREIYNTSHEKECNVCLFPGCGVKGEKGEIQRHIATDHKSHVQVLFREYQSLKESRERKINILKHELEEASNELQRLKEEVLSVQKLTSETSIDIEKTKMNQGGLDIGNNSEIKSVVENQTRRIALLENRKAQGTDHSFKMSLQTFEETIATHKKEISEIEMRLSCVETTNYKGILHWRISDYKQHYEDAKSGVVASLYSQPFYTHMYGYKMCARLYPNGDGMGKTTHMSLFFVVMRGEYDALLPWPFKQRITLSLIDQDKQQQHIIDAFRPDPSSSSFSKPVNEMNISSGCPLFVKQEIGMSPTYLKDNTIYIKIVVDTSDLV